MAINAITNISRTIGNFLGFANKSFPIDADGLTDMQLNEKLLSVLGNIGGNKYILMGCTIATNYAGYVFLATSDNPSGELLYVESGSGTTLHLKTTTVDISASGYDYTSAYTKRTLAWGIGTENFAFAYFKQLRTNADLATDILALQTTLAGIVPEAIGSMKFWAGTVENKPLNWLECAAQSLQRTEYPELFAVIGTTYGYDDNSSFKLPNTRGRVPVAYNVGDDDFKPVGKTNAYTAKTHTLTVSEIPTHQHAINGQDNDATPNGSPSELGNVESWTGAGAIRSTQSVGGGNSHNNLQPYMALPFIIKVK